MTAYIVLGILNGATVALTAIGLVLVFRAAKFVNFAHAQLGVLPMLILGKLVLEGGLSWYVACVIALVLGAAVGALSETMVIRRLADRSRMTLLVATIGLSNVLMGISYIESVGADRDLTLTKGFPVPFRWRAEVDGLALSTHHLLTALVVPAAAAALYFFFKQTVTGKSIRAAASNAEAAALAGLNIRRLSTLTWAIAGLLSTTSAILTAPNVARFDPAQLGPGLMLRALAAAAFGGFTSFPTAFGAGIGLGVLEQVAIKQTGDSGTGTVVLFLAVVVGLAVRGRRTSVSSSTSTLESLDLAEKPLTVPDVLANHVIVRHARLTLIGVGTLIVFILPHLPPFETPSQQYRLTTVLITVLVVATVTSLAGWAGQVTLGQYAFVGVGAILGGRFLVDGWELSRVFVVVGVVGAVFAVAIGAPVLRYRGLALAVTTLGFAIVCPYWLFLKTWFSGQSVGSFYGAQIPVTSLFGMELSSTISTYNVTAVAVVLLLLGLAALRRSPRGRLLIAVRDNEAAATVVGVSPTMMKLSMFAVAGAVTSIGGVLLVMTTRSTSANNFPPDLSLVYLAIAVIGGLGSIPGAIIGTIAIAGMPLFLDRLVTSVFPSGTQFQLLFAGLSMILVLIMNPGGIAAVMRMQWERLLARIATGVHDRKVADAAVEPVPLRSRGVRVEFGELVAVNDVSIEVRPGEIVGLIGNNGAGKTTFINAVSGNLAPTSGSIRIFGREVTGYGPDFRATFGMSRTFQDARLVPGLTVREILQIALGREAPFGVVSSMIGAPWVRYAERKYRAQADDIIRQFNLGQWADVRAEDLSTGVRRIVDIATQVAMKTKLILLDEPTAGLSQKEAESFGPLLRGLVADLGCSVLIVEHDMPLMLSVSDRIYCLELGAVIAEGAPQEIRRNPRVIASYLGGDSVAVERSGPVGVTAAAATETATAAPLRRPRRPGPLAKNGSTGRSVAGGARSATETRRRQPAKTAPAPAKRATKATSAATKRASETSPPRVSTNGTTSRNGKGRKPTHGRR